MINLDVLKTVNFDGIVGSSRSRLRFDKPVRRPAL